MIADFQVENKIEKLRHLQKIFLVVIIKVKIVLKIFFLKFSKADILFNNEIFM